MEYIEQIENIKRIYSVFCDIKELKKILKILSKDYKYETVGHRKIDGNIINNLATKENLQIRIIDYINKEHLEEILCPESITYHTENGNNYITYDCLYNKYPNLCIYIATFLYSQTTFEKQIALKSILNYINDTELTDNNSTNNKKPYDYKGLNELYDETLRCFKFYLVSETMQFKEPTIVDTHKLQHKKI